MELDNNAIYIIIVLLGSILILNFRQTIFKNKQKQTKKTVKESNNDEIIQSYTNAIQVFKQNEELMRDENLKLNRRLAKEIGLNKTRLQKKFEEDEEFEDEEEEDLTADEILEQYDIDFTQANSLSKTMNLPAGLSNMITPETIKNPAIQSIAMGYLADHPDYLQMAIKAGVLVPKGTLNNGNNQSGFQSPSSESTQPSPSTQLSSL